MTQLQNFDSVAAAEAGLVERGSSRPASLLRDVRLLFKRRFLQTLRNPVWVAIGLSTPILYMVLFLPLLDNFKGMPGFPPQGAIQIFLPGILALLAFGSGTGAGFGTIFELKQGMTERLRVSPASRFALMVAPILADILWLSIFCALVIVIAVPFGFEVHAGGLLVSFVLLALLLSITAAFSISMALITKEIASLAAVVNGMNLPIMLLSGVLLPLSAGGVSLAPSWMLFVAHFNPMYYVVEADRALATGSIWNSTVQQAFLVVVPLTAFVFWWATGVYRKAVS